MVDFTVSPDRTALVNVGLQNFFVDATEHGVALVRRINALASKCREAGILVIHTATSFDRLARTSVFSVRSFPPSRTKVYSTEAARPQSSTLPRTSTLVTSCWRSLDSERSTRPISS
jgi:nicotinamidase-related amidase